MAEELQVYPSTESTVLHNENSTIRSRTGVKLFHDAGYYGERVTMATGENWNINVYNPDALVRIPFGNGNGWGNFGGEHGCKTAATFFQVAPKSKLFQMSKVSSARTGKNCYCGLEDYCMDIIQQYNVLGIFCSFNQICDKYLDEKYTSLLDQLETFKYVVSAGNDYGDDYNELMECDAIFGIGACYVSGSSFKPESFTSRCEYVDFSAPDRQTTKFKAKEDTIIEYGKNSGTSFSAPWFLGQLALLDDYFIDKTGKPLSYKAAFEFVKDNCKDIDEEGFDEKSGNGVFVLPEPSSIVLENYQDQTTDTPLTPPEEEEKPEEPDTPEVPEIDPENQHNYRPVTTIDDNNISITLIPYDSIKEVGFAKCNEPTETVKSWYARQEDKPQLVTNGGLFNMSSGTNILSFIEEGIEQNYSAGFEGMGVKYDNTAFLTPGTDSDGNWKDFMSAYPVIVRDGVALTEFDKANEINYQAARTAVGITSDGSIISVTVDAPGTTFKELAKIMVKYNAWFAMNLDGGGSVYKMQFGEVINDPTEERAIDNVFYVKLKELKDMSENPEVNLKPLPKVDPGEYYATTEIEFKAGIDSSPDEPSNVIGKIAKGDKIEVISTSEWNGNTWAVVEYNYQRGYIVYTGDNLDTEMPLPAIFRITEAVDPLEKSDMVIVDYIDYDANTARVAAKADIEDLNDLSTFYAIQIPDMTVDLSLLSYICAYQGTLIPDDEEEEPDIPVTPGEGGGEGDEPEDPDVDDDLFPAIYEVNPEMVNSVLNVRKTPSTSGEIIGTMDPGTEITVLNIDGAWAEFEYNDGTAYCSAGYLIYVRPADEEEEPEEPEQPDEPEVPDEPETPVEPEEPVKVNLLPMKAVIGIVIEATEDLEAGDIVWIKSTENGIAKVVNNLCEDRVPIEVSMDNLSVVGMIGSLDEEETPTEPEEPEDPDPEEPENPDDGKDDEEEDQKPEEGETDDELLAKFTDADQISDEHMNGVLFALESGILIGRTETTLCPKDALTREEAATMFYRFACLEAGLNPDDDKEDEDPDIIEVPIE